MEKFVQLISGGLEMQDSSLSQSLSLSLSLSLATSHAHFLRLSLFFCYFVSSG